MNSSCDLILGSRRRPDEHDIRRFAFCQNGEAGGSEAQPDRPGVDDRYPHTFPVRSLRVRSDLRTNANPWWWGSTFVPVWPDRSKVTVRWPSLTTRHRHAVEVPTSSCPCSHPNVVGLVLRAVLLAHHARHEAHAGTASCRRQNAIRCPRLRRIC